MTTKVH